MSYPDFLIIGAMKCATSSLYRQLNAQPGIYMPRLKEPNYFSDDDQYQRGEDWYLSLFDEARPDELKGEASTHYTKLPSHPSAVARMPAQMKSTRFIYVMRDPVERLISQYMHEWSQRTINCSLDVAIQKHPHLVQYSCYSYQLTPYIEKFGFDSILPVFFERLKQQPQLELERICRFLGYVGEPQWQYEISRENVSSRRLRHFPGYGLLVDQPFMASIRRALIPQFLRDRVKHHLTLSERPQISPMSVSRVLAQVNPDLQLLGEWLGTPLNYANYHHTVSAAPLDWVAQEVCSAEQLPM